MLYTVFININICYIIHKLFYFSDYDIFNICFFVSLHVFCLFRERCCHINSYCMLANCRVIFANSDYLKYSSYLLDNVILLCQESKIYFSEQLTFISTN